MNPIKWRREHQLALCIGFVIGSMIWPIVGWRVVGQRYPFEYWLWNHIEVSGQWAIVGGLLASAVVYVAHLLRE